MSDAQPLLSAEELSALSAAVDDGVSSISRLLSTPVLATILWHRMLSTSLVRAPKLRCGGM